MSARRFPKNAAQAWEKISRTSQSLKREKLFWKRVEEPRINDWSAPKISSIFERRPSCERTWGLRPFTAAKRRRKRLAILIAWGANSIPKRLRQARAGLHQCPLENEPSPRTSRLKNRPAQQRAKRITNCPYLIIRPNKTSKGNDPAAPSRDPEGAPRSGEFL